MHVVYKRLVTAVTLGTSLSLAAMSSSLAHDAHKAKLSIEQAHTLATPPGAKVAAGYLTLNNNGTVPDRLVGGSAPFAEVVEIHMTRVENDVASMREMEDGLALPAGESVTLASGGLHLMFIGLQAPLKEGDSHTITLKFEQAGEMDIDFEVRGVGAQSTNAGMNHGMNHGSDTDKKSDGNMSMDPGSDSGSMDHENMENMGDTEDTEDTEDTMEMKTAE